MYFPPGSTVERYTVEHRLGVGGVATVYAVRHSVLGTRHALKVLRSSAPGAKARLLREGRLQARLDPLHIVPVTDVLEVSGTPALLMPLVEGCSLARLLAHHHLPEPEVAALFAGIVAGVASAHSAGIVHRDIKPANVLLDLQDGAVVPRVADFGLAHQDDGLLLTQSGFMGTPAYAAPEQLRGEHTDERADLFSLGVVLFEMLTGSRPFLAPSIDSLADAIASGSYEEAQLPAAWRGLVGALLAATPAARPPSAAALLARLPASDPRTLGPGRSLARRVLAQQRDADPGVGALTTTRPLASAAPPISQERDAFIGRADELAALGSLLRSDARLITVIGTGGVGKTRLVTHAVRAHSGGWPGGVWLCSLAEARTADGLASLMAETLRVQLHGADALGAVGRALCARGRCLVILDNVEQIAHLAEASISRWLDLAPQAQLVVTSRTRLQLSGERLLDLQPLPLAEGVALFTERAQALQASWPGRPETLRELVSMLDGLPLAIELAANRVRMMSPEQLLHRMSQRFRLLTANSGRPSRHATLQATIEWSWALLSPEQQRAMAQLSVFEGGFSLPAAEAVIALSSTWPLDVLQQLIDRSLLYRAGPERLEMLSSIQAYAAAQLPPEAAAAAEARHGAWFARLGHPTALAEQPSARALQRLSRDMSNLVRASDRAKARGDAETAAASMLAAAQVWASRGPLDGARARLAAVRAMPGAARIAELLVAEGACWLAAGDTVAALGCFRDALQYARSIGDMYAFASALSGQGRALWQQGDLQAGIDHHQRALSLYRACGTRRACGAALLELARLQRLLGHPDDARPLLQEALQLYTDSSDRPRLSLVHAALAQTFTALERPDDAHTHRQRAQELTAALSDRELEAQLRGQPLPVRHIG